MLLGIFLFAVLVYVTYRVILSMTAMPMVHSIEEPLDYEDDEVDDEPVPVRVEPVYGALNPDLLARPDYQGPWSNSQIDTFGPPAEHQWDAFATPTEPQPWLKPIEVISASPIETVVAPSEAVQQLYPDSTDTEE
jgi:hypothetical protein